MKTFKHRLNFFSKKVEKPRQKIFDRIYQDSTETGHRSNIRYRVNFFKKKFNKYSAHRRLDFRLCLLEAERQQILLCSRQQSFKCQKYNFMVLMLKRSFRRDTFHYASVLPFVDLTEWYSASIFNLNHSRGLRFLTNVMSEYQTERHKATLESSQIKWLQIVGMKKRNGRWPAGVPNRLSQQMGPTGGPKRSSQQMGPTGSPIRWDQQVIPTDGTNRWSERGSQQMGPMNGSNRWDLQVVQSGKTDRESQQMIPTDGTNRWNQHVVPTDETDRWSQQMEPNRDTFTILTGVERVRWKAAFQSE